MLLLERGNGGDWLACYPVYIMLSHGSVFVPTYSEAIYNLRITAHSTNTSATIIVGPRHEKIGG